MKINQNNRTKKFDKANLRKTKRKQRMSEELSNSDESEESNDFDNHFYYKIQYILEQSGSGYSISKIPSKYIKKRGQRIETEKFLNKLVGLGWRSEYIQSKFQNMNDSLIQGWPHNLLVDNLFKEIIEEENNGNCSIKDSLINIGLQDSVATSLEILLEPLIDSSYTSIQLLHKAIEYLLGDYNPISPPNATHPLEPLYTNIWKRYEYDTATSKSIKIYNISEQCSSKKVVSYLESALKVLQKNNVKKYYFHTTSWRGSLSIMNNGIQRSASRPCLDFGITRGFYLSTQLIDSIDWGIKNNKLWQNEVAICVFTLPLIFPKYIRYKELKGTEWTEVTKEARECVKKDIEMKQIREYDFLYGDMVSNVKQVRQQKELPIPHSPPKKQLVGRTDIAEKLLDKCIIGVIYFQKFTES